MLKKLCFHIIFFVCFLFSHAQLPIFSHTEDTLYYIDYHTLYHANNKPIFNFKGNIIFNGASTHHKNIAFTLKHTQAPEAKQTIVYERDGSISPYFLQNDTVFYQHNKELYPLMFYTTSLHTTAAYSCVTDSLLYYFPAYDSLKALNFALFVVYERTHELSKQAVAWSNKEITNTLAYVSPYNHNGYTWVWDGRFFYPYGVNKNHPLVWEYTDDKLSPKNFPRNQEEWRWDGTSLKPYWGGNPLYEWSWQNGVLRQIWNNNYKNEYIIEDNVLRKRFSSFGEPEWEIHGEVPLPLLTALVLGYLYR